MNQINYCLICNSSLGYSSKNCVNIFEENNFLQSKLKLHEVISDVLETEVVENKEQFSVVCKKCQKALTEYDSLNTRLQFIKHKLNDSYNRSLKLFPRFGKTIESPQKTPTKESKRIVLPASKLQPLPPNYVIDIAKLGTPNAVFPKIETVGSLLPRNSFVKLSNNLNITTVMTHSSPIKGTSTTNTVTSPKITNTSNKVIVSALKVPSVNTTPTKETKNPVMSYNVNLPRDFLSSAVSIKAEEKDDSNSSSNQIVINKLNDNINNDEQQLEIDENCTLSVVPFTTENGELVIEKEKSLKPQSSNFFDVGLLLEGDNDTETGTSEREEIILDKLRILNENLDDDDDDDNGQAIVVEEGDHDGRARIICMGQQVNDPLDDGNDDDDQHDSNDESQIELQVSGDEETANAIIAAAQEQGGAFIKVESGEMYRVKSVKSQSEPVTVEDEASMSISNIVEAMDEGAFKCVLCENNHEETDIPLLKGDAEFMMQHLKSLHRARLYICQFCQQVMRRKNEYVAHIEDHATKNKIVIINTKIHQCVICKKAFNSRTLLSDHMNVHTGTRPYACEACNKSFASKYTLQAHLKTHEERPRPFKCKLCDKAFLTQHNLSQHEKTHSGVKEFICTVCDKAFATQHNLEVHCVVHTGRKSFFCSVCDKSFARRAEVKDHMRIHTGERPFACEVCGATFSQRSNLHSHRRATHLDDRRHHCTLCPKRFKRRRLLDYHVKSAHTGERPLKCDVCKASFVYPEHYKKHIRIHSGERPFVCEVCGKSFNSRDNRNMHRFVHSDKKPYECLTCGAGYMRKQLLYAHMNTTGHVAESIVVNQPKVITTVENVYETTTELEMNENEVQTTESEISVLRNNELLSLHNIIGTKIEDKLEQPHIITTDSTGNTMRLIQLQLADGKNGWVAINS